MNMDEFNVPRFLAVLSLFSDLSAAELDRVALGCQLRRMVRGDTVFRFGEPCEEFHVVVSGQVKLFATSPTGQEKVIDLVGSGHSFGEALMFTGKPYILNAQALTSTLLLSVSKQSMLAEIELDPRFSMRMLGGISRRMHGLVQDIESRALESGVQRVIGYFLRELHLEDYAPGEVLTVSLPVSKASVASRLSLTPEYFSKVLRALEAEKLIEIDKRNIHIVDAHRLAGYGAR